MRENSYSANHGNSVALCVCVCVCVGGLHALTFMCVFVSSTVKPSQKSFYMLMMLSDGGKKRG